MYLETIVLTRTVPCLAEPSKIIVFGKPSRSLDDVLPYLATLPNVISYNPKGGSLTLRREPGFITLLADQVYITKVRDVEEGIVLLSHLVDAINATWEHRQELVAATAAHRAPRMLDIWSLLPQTNCASCGEATCMAFAVALLQHRRSFEECPLLATDTAFTEQRATLEAIL